MPTPSGGYFWTSTTGAQGAFKEYGDILYVKDTSTDGYSPYVLWENRLSDTNGTWHLYRHGRCEYYGGSGHWGACNKNMYETGNENALGGVQSQVRIKTCRNVPSLPDNCSDWSGRKNNDG